jgi:hypothetical protein
VALSKNHLGEILMARITDNDRSNCLKQALTAADWFVNQQLVFERPWCGDQYRYCYYYFMPRNSFCPD